MTTRYFSSLIEQSLSRSTEATLSIMGVTDRCPGHLCRSRDDAGLSQPAGNDSGAGVAPE